MGEETKSAEKEVTFDDVITYLGEFGWYQKRVFFMMCLLPMTVAVQTIMTVFTMAVPDHRCEVPELSNDTFQFWGPAHEEIVNQSIPWELNDDDEIVRSSCQLYANRTLPAPPSTHLVTNRTTESCSRWVFDRSTFDSTFTEEAFLVCDKKTYRANADMLYMVGVLTGSFVIGLISDRFGRKTALMLGLVAHLGCSLGTAFVKTYTAFVVLRFFIGMANLSVFLVAYVLGLELVGSSYRTLAGAVIQMAWPVGLFLQTGVAYGVRDWSNLQLALTCPAFLFLIYFWVVKESPRWLASRERIEEANNMLAQIAKVNGKPPPPKLNKATDEAEVKKESPVRMFTNKTTLIRTLIILINWVVVTMVYYGLSLNVGSLGGSIYLNNFLSSAAELLGYIVALAGLNRLGRKVMHCGSMILGGAACLASMFPVMYGGDSLSWLVIVLSNVGKLGASGGFCIIYLFSAELYPTVSRNSLMGISSMVARVGGIVSPYVGQLNVIIGGDLGVALPLVIFGGAALGAGLLALMLPETLGRPLPETIEDAINYTKKPPPEKTSDYAYPNKGYEAENGVSSRL